MFNISAFLFINFLDFTWVLGTEATSYRNSIPKIWAWVSNLPSERSNIASLTFSTGESLALGSGEILWIIIDIKNVESSS